MKTNLDVRGYAASRGVTLSDIAAAMGISPSRFSIAYMSRELRADEKEMLKGVVDEVAKNDTGRVQEA